MARKKTATLTEGELRMMEVVWDLGEASVRNVTDNLLQKEAIAYNTVQTMMRILCEKGYLQHEKRGRSFIYTPLVVRKVARAQALRNMLSKFFDDSPQALMVNLLEDQQMDANELQQLKTLIQASEAEGDDD